MTAPNRIASQKSRDKIIDEAARQFNANGYRATTNATIANAIDVAPTLINHFFGSKAGLYHTIFDHNPMDEDKGRKAALVLGVVLTAIESRDQTLQSEAFESWLRRFVHYLGTPPVGLAPQWPEEMADAYIERQFAGIFSATAETPGCEICRGFFWKNDDTVPDVELGTTHYECNKDSPVVDLDTLEPLPDQSIAKLSVKYGEDGL